MPFVAVTTYAVTVWLSVGVPVISLVEVLSVKVDGKDGEIEYVGGVVNPIGV